ncbi:MAG: helix-turn-helix transcriptional regulator [Labilithrix sp.]|nr:helix-turn-helix transcriptional regulator [Labilithrix sp.]MCW5809645.1 helix-turn-helix transcriptional regulator [Labilithrix sp.]
MRRDRRLGEVAAVAFDDLVVDETSWLSSVAHALEDQCGEGYGCIAAAYAPTSRSIGFDAMIGAGVRTDIDARGVFAGTVAAPPEMTRRVYAEVQCETTSGLGVVCERNFQERVFDWGVRDAVCVNAQREVHRGAAFLLLHPRRRRLRMGERRWLEDLAALLRIAIRRRAIARPTLAAPPSRTAPLLTGTRSPDERRRLHRAGFEPIRELEEDGRRRLVVEPIAVGPLAVLSTRERAAVLALPTTTSNKEIAALLGTSASTIGVLLHRAATKLGVRHREELVALASAPPD